MLNSLPEETTQLLIDVCTSLTPLTIDTEERGTPSRQPSTGGGPSYLSYLALNRDRGVSPTSATAPAISTGDRSSQQDSPHESRTATPPPGTPTNGYHTLPQPRASAVKRPSPRIYFPHFIDHKEKFVHFLESVAVKRWGQRLEDNGVPVVVENDPFIDPQTEQSDQAAVWNTLLELYLSSAMTAEESKKQAFIDKALKILKSEDIPCDSTHALILCSTQNFTPGLVLLWEKLGMYEDVARFWIDKYREGGEDASHASSEVVRCLDHYGAEHPHLYPLVLRFLTSSPELLSKHTTDVTKMLEYIDEEKIMPPLSVVQVLSRNGVASVGLVKQWLVSRIKAAQDEIDTVSVMTFILLIYRIIMDVFCRIKNLSTLTVLKRTLNSSKLRRSQTQNILRYSMSPNARHARASSTCQVFTLCAIIAITSGTSQTLQLGQEY